MLAVGFDLPRWESAVRALKRLNGIFYNPFLFAVPSTVYRRGAHETGGDLKYPAYR